MERPTKPTSQRSVGEASAIQSNGRSVLIPLESSSARSWSRVQGVMSRFCWPASKGFHQSKLANALAELARSTLKLSIDEIGQLPLLVTARFKPGLQSNKSYEVATLQSGLSGSNQRTPRAFILEQESLTRQIKSGSGCTAAAVRRTKASVGMGYKTKAQEEQSLTFC
jgi:hypothetical protein